MSDNRHNPEGLHASLQQVIALLHRHKIVEELIHRQDMPKHDLVEDLVHRQKIVELQKRLDQTPLLMWLISIEALPLEERLLVWDLVKSERDGEFCWVTSRAKFRES